MLQPGAHMGLDSLPTGAPVLGQSLQCHVSCRRLGRRAAPSSESQSPVTSECAAGLTATQCSLMTTMAAA